MVDLLYISVGSMYVNIYPYMDPMGCETYAQGKLDHIISYSHIPQKNKIKKSKVSELLLILCRSTLPYSLNELRISGRSLLTASSQGSLTSWMSKGAGVI